jgi:hypothetical protein
VIIPETVLLQSRRRREIIISDEFLGHCKKVIAGARWAYHSFL